MGFMGSRSTSLLFLLISAILLSASSAGGHRKFVDKTVSQVGSATITKESPKKFLHKDEAVVIHPRMLKVHTNDYGRYDPAPTFAKPPFKLINN